MTGRMGNGLPFALFRCAGPGGPLRPHPDSRIHLQYQLPEPTAGVHQAGWCHVRLNLPVAPVAHEAQDCQVIGHRSGAPCF